VRDATRICLRGAGLFIGCLVGGGWLSTAQGDWKADVGYNDLVAELGANVPTGSGIDVTQVEADDSGTAGLNYYRPNEASSNYSGTTFYNYGLAETYTTTSSHATTVANYFYGNTTSIAPDVVRANIWDAGSWLGNLGNPEYADVVNCSWVVKASSSMTVADATVYTQVFDWSIGQYDYVGVVGVNNGTSSTLPKLLCQNYNGISVGITAGTHSAGVTTLDGIGRMKPDIVAPTDKTSWATAMVSSAAAMLLDEAAAMPTSTMQTNAAHSQTIKSILLAGATKSEFGEYWAHDHDSPLDDVFGAGELNVQRSYHILAAQEQEASALLVGESVNDTGAGGIAAMGWDFASTAATGAEKLYYFSVTEGQHLSELSAVLTWNAVVTQSGPNLTTTLANLDLDLDLYAIGEEGSLTLVDYSNSTVDNVELLYLTQLASGNYAFGVKANTAGTNYALAWYIVAVPEPSVLVLLGIALVFGVVVYWRRGYRFHGLSPSP